MSGRARGIIESLAEEIRALAPEGGDIPTAAPGFHVQRTFTGTVDLPGTDTPYVYLVVAGSLRLHTPIEAVSPIFKSLSIMRRRGSRGPSHVAHTKHRSRFCCIASADLDYVLLTHLDCDHANGLKLVADAKRILAARDEIDSVKANATARIRFQSRWWDDTKIEYFDWGGAEGPSAKATTSSATAASCA